LLDAGATETTRTLLARCTPLHLASSSGIWQVVDLLLLQGVDANDTNRAYETALHCAKTTDVVKALMRGGAHANLKDRFGRTPGASARARGDDLVADYMREHSLGVAKAKIEKEREDRKKQRQAEARVEKKRQEAGARRALIERERLRHKLLADYGKWRTPQSKAEAAAERRARLEGPAGPDPRDFMGLSGPGGGGRRALPAIGNGGSGGR